MKSSSRLTNKERNLLKGAARRVFSRSEVRAQVLARTIVANHIDLSRPRVKTWCKCEKCGKLEAKSNIEVDHIQPVIPLDKTLTDLSWDELIEERIWCDISNLWGLCIPCHDEKTKEEKKERTLIKKSKRESK